MELGTIVLSVLGLCLFEVVSSLDNAVVNADVLATMEKRWRKWFLVWGIFIGVFMVRGLLPWLIVYFSNTSLGFFGSFTATFSNDPQVTESLQRSSPLLLIGGSVFLIFLFFHWLFLEPKKFGLHVEEFFVHQGVWFFTVISVALTLIIWFALKKDPMMAFSASIGATAFFITHGFKEYAAKAEAEMRKNKANMSDISKIMYLEVLDATFSIDGVVGAFAFTTSVPLIILGNGIGAIVVRQATIHGVDRIRNYPFLKNGAMYSIGCLGIIMLLHSFGVHVPEYVAPLLTFAIVGFFFRKSVRKDK